MNNATIAAAERLADVLELENAALRGLDFRAATRLLEDKVRAMEALTARHADAVPIPPEHVRAAARLRGRLEGLAIENQRLLETALQVQGRVIAAIARTASRDMAGQAACYGANGAVAAQPTAMAISARV